MIKIINIIIIFLISITTIIIIVGKLMSMMRDANCWRCGNKFLLLLAKPCAKQPETITTQILIIEFLYFSIVITYSKSFTK